MSQSIEVVLFLSIISLTVVFVIVGVSLFLLLKELRRGAKQVNETLEELTSFADQLRRPEEMIPGLIEGIKSGLVVIQLIKEFFSRDERKK